VFSVRREARKVNEILQINGTSDLAEFHSPTTIKKIHGYFKILVLLKILILYTQIIGYSGPKFPFIAKKR
jgi:hypothetical protein